MDLINQKLYNDLLSMYKTSAYQSATCNHYFLLFLLRFQRLISCYHKKYCINQYKSFENTVGKGEIARNEQFLLFPVFSTHSDDFLPFPSNLNLSSAYSSSFGKGLTSKRLTRYTDAWKGSFQVLSPFFSNAFNYLLSVIPPFVPHLTQHLNQLSVWMIDWLYGV